MYEAVESLELCPNLESHPPGLLSENGEAIRASTEAGEWRCQAKILRDIIGNPFRPSTLNPFWRTSNALALAQLNYDDRQFADMPILADALEDAGCDNDTILSHCRGNTPTFAAAGCWICFSTGSKMLLVPPPPVTGAVLMYRLSAISFILFATLASAGDWPAWRGPTGQGVCDEKNLPLHWDAKSGKNILWKMPLPGHDGKAKQDQNQSSPVVIAGKVFVTSSIWPEGVANKEFPEHHVFCFDATSGKQVWDVKVAHGPWLRASDLRGGYSAPTPAADRERVVVCFGSSVLACLDHDGKQIWRKEIIPYDFDVAMASSPVLHAGTAILQLDGVKGSRIIAYDLKSGDEKWTQKRPTAGFCHSTPVLAKLGKKVQLLVAASNAVQGVDPDDGKLLWWCKGAGDTVSPVVGEGLVYCDSGRGSIGVCVDPAGEGDVTKTHRKWQIDRVPNGFSSPVVVAGRLYRLVDPGTLRSWKMADGEEGETLRLQGVSTSPSPFVTPEGRIYCASAGRSFVVKAGEKMEILATNELNDGSHASPAVAGGRIYLKGRRYLWCIGSKSEK